MDFFDFFSPIYGLFTREKRSMTLENRHVSRGNTSSNGGCSIVMLVFAGGTGKKWIWETPPKRGNKPKNRNKKNRKVLRLQITYLEGLFHGIEAIK